MAKKFQAIDATPPEAVAVHGANRTKEATARKNPADLYAYRLQVGLTADAFRDLSALSAYYGVPMARIGRDVIERYLESQADVLDALATGRGASYAESLEGLRCTSGP